MFSALAGDDTFEKVYNEKHLEKGGVTMCDVVERIRNEGRVQGQAEGRVQGRAEGQENAREEMILNLLESNAGYRKA